MKFNFDNIMTTFLLIIALATSVYGVQVIAQIVELEHIMRDAR